MDHFLPYECNLTTRDIVKYYHSLRPKFKYKEILEIVTRRHDRQLSFRSLKRILFQENLNRKRNISESDLEEAVQNELRTSNSLLGYRQMTEILSVKYKINVSRESVRKTLLRVDPDGVAVRQRRLIKRRVYITDGPGDIYHIDGNDKLKRWGFAIHGAVDGFSRKVMWLVVSTTNNDPLVIGNLFLSCVKRHRVAPITLRMDCGNENIYCEDLQVFFTGSERSYMYAKSTRNQRIESFWARLKKFKTSWWIDFFQHMTKSGLYHPDVMAHQELLLFCFLPVIQLELNDFFTTWNSRNVRKSASGPGGKPDMLFQFPTTTGHGHQGKVVSQRDIEIAEEILKIDEPPRYKNRDFHLWA